MHKVVAVVLSLLVVGSQAQLDSCEGCLSTIGTFASFAATPESIDRQLELLISTACQAQTAPPDCEENFRTYWPGATTALYGPENVDYTVHQLCKLATHCNAKKFSKSELGEYADCETCQGDMVTLGELYHQHKTISHLDTEIRRLYCDLVHGHGHVECLHFVSNYCPAAFILLGDYMKASADQLCQGVFECPTEEPTEEPTTMAPFDV